MPSDGIPILQYYNNIEIMDGSDRKKAIAALKLLMAKFRDVPSAYNSFSDIKEPLPEELPRILKFLAITCKQLTSLKNKNSTPSKAVISAKQLCMIARILRQILHLQQVSDYRALGLNDQATQEQIDNHYRWLNGLFAFDDSIDPQRRSIRRVMQAYITLRNLKFCNKESILPSALTRAEELNSDSDPIINEQTTTSVRVHEAHQRKGLSVTSSVLVFLTLSSGVGWWWLLASYDVEEVAKITIPKEIIQPKNEVQKPQQIAIVEVNQTKKAEVVREKISNSQKETNIEKSQQQTIKLTVASTQPIKKVPPPEIKTIIPSISTVTANDPNKKTLKNSAIIAISKKENKTTTPEKESIKAAKNKSKRELAINSANNWKQRNTTKPAQGDNLVIELAINSANNWKQRNTTKPVQNANLVTSSSEKKASFILTPP